METEIFDPVGINTVLTKYRYKKIHLKELLEFFQAEYFYNWVYANCSEELTKLITEEEASIYCLLIFRDHFTSLLTYPELADWKQLCDYVETLYNRDRCYKICNPAVINYEACKVSKINWETYSFCLRSAVVTSRMYEGN
jgi:hypothetical protein